MSQLYSYEQIAKLIGSDLFKMVAKLSELELCDKVNHKISQYAIENGFGVYKEIVMLGELLQLSFISEKGVNYIKEKICLDAEFLSDCLISRLSYAKYFYDSSADGKHEHADNILNSTIAIEDFYDFYYKYNGNDVKVLFFKKLEANELLDFAMQRDFFIKLKEVANIMTQKELLDKELPSHSPPTPKIKI